MAWRQYNKYRNEKVFCDGIQFDSKREAQRYMELKLLLKAGKIKDLERQVRYELIPTQREPDTYGKRGGLIKGKIIEKKVEYVADFVYTDVRTGKRIVEDTKGCKDGAGYAVFVIKRKLMLQRYGIRVREI